MHGQRPDLQGHGVELGMNQHEPYCATAPNRPKNTINANFVLNSGAFDIALSDGVDPGFGFRVLDPQGTPIKSGAALTNATFAFNTPASVQSISNNFTVQYAKTQTTLNPGVVSATIAITISFP